MHAQERLSTIDDKSLKLEARVTFLLMTFRVNYVGTHKTADLLCEGFFLAKINWSFLTWGWRELS